MQDEEEFMTDMEHQMELNFEIFKLEFSSNFDYELSEAEIEIAKIFYFKGIEDEIDYVEKILQDVRKKYGHLVEKKLNDEN